MGDVDCDLAGFIGCVLPNSSANDLVLEAPYRGVAQNSGAPPQGGREEALVWAKNLSDTIQ